jgi:hypothetical protein
MKGENGKREIVECVSEEVCFSTDEGKKVENVPIRDNAVAKKSDATGAIRWFGRFERRVMLPTPSVSSTFQTISNARKLSRVQRMIVSLSTLWMSLNTCH